jgi:predicted RNA-binding protein (virulence factor B family)
MLGIISQLRVVREADFGLFLADEDGNEVLLPSRYVPSGTAVRDSLDVFVYRDSDGRLTATTEQPKAQLGEFACLKVVGAARPGAFMDLGIVKDLLVPRGEQPDLFREGEWRVVKICVDEQTSRLYGTGDLRKHLSDFADCYKAGDKVDLMVFEMTDLGYKVIVDGHYWGVLYTDEVFADLEDGQCMPGYVKRLREDKKLDISLQAPGYAKVAGIEEQVLAAVEADGGFLALTAKSSADVIYQRFGVSKKSFKLAVSALYKKRLVTLEDRGIRGVSK